MASAILSQIIKLAGTLLQTSSDEPPRDLQVQEDLKALQRMVRRIQATLIDAEKREIQEESVKLWLRELKVLAYDAEDVLEEYEYELLHAKVEAGIQDDAAASHLPHQPKHKELKFEETRGSWFQKAAELLSSHISEVSKSAIASTSSSDTSFWDKLADKIKKIRVSFEEISNDRHKLHLREEDGERQFQNTIHRPPSSHIVDSPKIYGREDDQVKVINKLLCSDECQKSNLSVLPIVGMGGVGKTTLAQHVYNDQRTHGHFQMKGWVCVSDNDFNVGRLTARICESLSHHKCHLEELSALQQKLINLLNGRRFLLILDDVWNENVALWESLQKPLRFGMQGSAVIITTRSECAANIMKTMAFLHLECLSFDDCLTVFNNGAFVDRDPNNHPDLKEIGKQIVKKCDGLPLAAKSLGGLLRYKNEVDEWEEVLQSDIWNLHDRVDGILPALKLSYVHLPSHLKQCFRYAAIFPKDFIFEKEELILLWMAQGFLQSSCGSKQDEDVGNNCFNEFVQRSLFQVHSSHLGKINVVMHDLIHDLALYISEREILHIENDGADVPHSDEVRHVSIVVGQETVELDNVFRPAWPIRTLMTVLIH